MAINWHLKTFLSKKHGIYRPTDFQKLIVKKTNILISLPNISKLMNKKPSTISLRTMELLCSTLNCSLDDFCEVSPSIKKIPDKVKKLAFQHTPENKKAINNFPCPTDYEK